MLRLVTISHFVRMHLVILFLLTFTGMVSSCGFREGESEVIIIIRP